MDLLFNKLINFLRIYAQIALVSLAFAGSIGMTLIILACALPQYNVWHPFWVVLFYVLSVIPTLIAKRQEPSGACVEFSIFLTCGFVISSFALPIVLARLGTLFWGACYLTLSGNIVVYLSICAFFLFFDDEDDSTYYGGMA